MRFAFRVRHTFPLYQVIQAQTVPIKTDMTRVGVEVMVIVVVPAEPNN